MKRRVLYLSAKSSYDTVDIVIILVIAELT